MKVYSVQSKYKNDVCFTNDKLKLKATLQDNKKGILISAGVALGVLVSSVAVYKFHRPAGNNYSEFVKNLAVGVSAITGRKVNPFSLSCVMDKTEFVKEVSKLRGENYVYSPENIRKFGFLADFHMHTNHSDGNISVGKLLDEISQYSQNLFKRTGKKFMFSITDHDSVEGVKEALVIISKNPEKFRFVKFIPGVELSFAHSSPKSKNPFEISEVLAYGIDPFKFEGFCKKLQAKRTNMIDKMLQDIQQALPLTKFDKDELFKYFGLNPKILIMNSHWPVFHYAQTKHALTIQASRKGVAPDILYKDVMENIGSDHKNVWHLRQNRILDEDIDESYLIEDVRKSYAPHLEDNEFVSFGENQFEDLISELSDHDAVLSFAHPYFTAEKFHNPKEILNGFVESSEGLLQLSEGFHQAYPSHVNMDEVDKVNAYLDNLIQIGGSDNHRPVYIEVEK